MMPGFRTSYRILRQVSVSNLQKTVTHTSENYRNYSTNLIKCARGGNSRKNEVDGGGWSQKTSTKIQDFTIDRALQAVRTKLAEFGVESKESNLFLGTSQYFHKPNRDRILVLNSESGLDDFGLATSSRRDSDFIEPVLDFSLQSTDIDTFSDELSKIARNVCNGEVNAVDEGLWTHGFVVNGNIKIFSRSSLVSRLSHESFEYATEERLQRIPAHDITSIRVTLSDEPWNDQTLSLECKNDTIVPLLTFGYENDYRDLAMLMVDTEWSVKAAALLCLQLKRLGNKTVHLKLPKVLTIQGNPWVENRHDLWTRFSSRD